MTQGGALAARRVKRMMVKVRMYRIPKRSWARGMLVPEVVRW
jgi:hypothetical protein